MARYQEIADGIAALIASGTLRAGQRIPSVRKAAAMHKVSAGTVLQAFDQLEARGLIEARPQSGYYVRPQHAGLAPEPKSTTPAARAMQLDVSELVFDVLEQIKHRELVPLGSAFPSPELFPLARLNRMAAAMARRQKPWSSLDDLPPGNAELRHQIALRYMESACSVSPDDIVITCGALEAINLGLQAVTRPGDTVAIESPTFYSTLQAIERLGLRAVEIPTHPRTGIELASLEAALKSQSIKACVLITTFQNPLGACMPDENKAALVKLLKQHDVALIEDDVYAELYFDQQRPRPAKAFDKSGLVLHCGSFSKCLAPGYRVGWIAAGRYRAQVERIKLMTTLSTASLPQATIAEFLKHGAYERHLRHLRHTLASQCQEMMRAISQYFPHGCRMTRPSGGYMLWVELPKGIDALQLHRLALAEGISIAPGPIFSAQRKYRNCVRLNFAYPWTTQLEKSVRKLGQLAASLKSAEK